MLHRLPLLACLACSVASTDARGEVFVLADEGRIVGEWLNRNEAPPRTRYVIGTPTGGVLTLDQAQVADVIAVSPAEEEYLTIQPRFADTVDDQWRLAEWCGEQRLLEERNLHLQRVIELEPDHAEARRALGYTQIDGEWKTQAERMTERGYVRYKGRWRLPQQIELMERRRDQEEAEALWFRNIKRWRGWLDADRSREAVDNITAIDDSSAVKALEYFLAREEQEAVRILFVEALAHVGTPAAINVLGERSLEDVSREVRLTCIDYLKTEKRPEIVRMYVDRLRDKSNPIVNRAAIGLKELDDPSAIRPLIDALVTTHKTKITSGSPGGLGATFGGPGGAGGGGLSVGSRTQLLVQNVRNSEVLDALVVLSDGVNYGYDQQAWKYWRRTQHDDSDLNLRRD